MNLYIVTELFENKIFANLKGAAPVLFIFFVFKVIVSGQKEMTFSFSDVSEYDISPAKFKYGMSELVKTGILIEVYKGGAGAGDKSIYSMSDKYRELIKKGELIQKVKTSDEIYQIIIEGIKKKENTFIIGEIPKEIQNLKTFDFDHGLGFKKTEYEAIVEKMKSNGILFNEQQLTRLFKDGLTLSITEQLIEQNKQRYCRFLNTQKAFIVFNLFIADFREYQKDCQKDWKLKRRDDLIRFEKADCIFPILEIFHDLSTDHSKPKRIHEGLRNLLSDDLKICILTNSQDLNKKEWPYIKRILDKHIVVMSGTQDVSDYLQKKHRDIYNRFKFHKI